MSGSKNDQYSKKAEDNSISLKDKEIEVQAIIKKVGPGMLTTVGTDGSSLHSRAMYAASTEKLIFQYIYDNSSHKDDEVKHDANVNISYLGTSGGDWISVAGKASTSQDQALKDKLFNPMTKAWFGDLGDGVHDGTAKDPRVSVMSVKPTEIRYHAKKETMIAQAVEVVSAAITGSTAAPGVIRTITAQEIESLQ